MNTALLSKPVLIHVCKDRTLSYTYGKNRGKAFNKVALPVFSVDDVDTAERLITAVGCVQYEPHPKMPNQTWRKINIERKLDDGSVEFVQHLEFEDLPLVEQKLNDVYSRIKGAYECT